MNGFKMTDQNSEFVKIKFAIVALTDMLKWSDRLGSDEIIEIKTIIKKLKK